MQLYLVICLFLKSILVNIILIVRFDIYVNRRIVSRSLIDLFLGKVTSLIEEKIQIEVSPFSIDSCILSST